MRPREKLQTIGREALSNQELLQILVGSGNATASAARIAKRSLKLLEKHGNHITFSQLNAVSGLGPARTCQIIAAFELASRYPRGHDGRRFNTNDELLVEIRSKLTTAAHLVFITFDGAGRHLATRRKDVATNVKTGNMLRVIFSDVVSDNASGIVVAYGAKAYHKTPSLFDLSLARSIKIAAELFGVRVIKHLIISDKNCIELENDSV